MLIVDDILRLPVCGFLWVAHEICNAARRELAAESEQITGELMNLHMLLEAGEITTEEFDTREKDLLNRLDEIEN